MAEGGNSKQFVYESEIRGFSVGSEKNTRALPFMFKRWMPILLSLYFWRSICSQEESTDIGKNMYANWNINYASEKHLGVRLLEHIR